MKKLLFILIPVIILLVIGGYFVSKRAGIIADPIKKEVIFNKQVLDNRQIDSQESVDYQIEEVARDLFVPWSIVFTSNERILVAQRSGEIVEISPVINPKRIMYQFDDVATGDEEGLMGMALHPNYPENKYIYACYAYSTDDGLADRVVRLIDNNESISFDRVIIEDIPAARFHAGCRIEFGPDGKLFITTGDATDKQIAQDPNSLGGKILRLNDDGTIPDDNPIENSYIYSLGHRNPQGIDWDSEGQLYSSEHGPSGFDGPGGGDELNRIIAGENYGWPVVSHLESREDFVDPLVVWTPAIAPASLLVYKSDLIPQFRGDILMGGLRGEGIYRVIVQNGEVGKWERIVEGYGRIRDVVQSPTGEIYFSTSNQDGRGNIFDGDDKIYKLTPKIDTANFEIYTNGTKRVFSETKYHNQSDNAYIEEIDPSKIILKKTVTWQKFFDTLPSPMKVTQSCLTTGTGQEFCNNDNKNLNFYLNGTINNNVLKANIESGDNLVIRYE